MQLWEYTNVVIMNNKVYKIPRINSSGLSLDMPVADCLTELGNSGWELAGVASQVSESYQLFFKRPKQR